MIEALNNLNRAMTSFGGNGMEDIGVLSFIFLMTVSLLCSFVIASYYLTFYSNQATGSQIHRAFPLLGLSITAVFVCIQFSLPLSLGLLGALSIVRFRTPIKEPEEVGFIMLVVAVSIACATFNMVFVGILLALSLVALSLLRWGPSVFDRKLNHGIIQVSIPQELYQEKHNDVLNVLKVQLKTGKLESITKNGERSILHFSFSKLKQDSVTEIEKSIDSISKNIALNFYFNRASAL